MHDDPHWERTLRQAASAPRQPHPAQHTSPQPAQDPAGLRKADPVNYLLPASSLWLASLPREVRPLALVTKYPRIVNLLAQDWNDHEACAAYFGHLLVDHRGNRQGFPIAVKSDIRILQEYFMHSATMVDTKRP
jgi:hypothetical protein